MSSQMRCYCVVIPYPGTGHLNPLHYPDWWELMRENFEDISVETIDQMYVNVVERILNSSNPIREVVIRDRQITNVR